MTYALFCQILNDNLVFEFTDNVSVQMREEYQQDWYIEFKGAAYVFDDTLTDMEKVVCWMRDWFSECSFDTHNFQLKPGNE